MFLGIDLGTSSVKALLLDEGQRILADATRPLTVARPHPGWSEQDPESWWQALLGVTGELRAARPRDWAAVRGIGLSGQMHGAVALDAAGAVLRPCILWNDTRAAAECRAMEAAVPELHAIAGNLAMPGFTAPKLLWLQRHETEAFSRTRHVLLPKAWLGYRLTGEMVEEMSDASGTLWLDVARRDWSEALLAATGLSRAAMPRLVEGSAPAGRMRPALAAEWGFDQPPVLAGGAGDNAAGAVGLGAIRPGDAFISLGTSGVVFATTDRCRPWPQGAVHSFCHALPRTWHQMAVTLSAAASLAWWAGVARESEAALLAELTAVQAPGPVFFLPYLSGERTPHNDGAVRGAFAGLAQESDRAAMTQAVLEGVAFSLRDGLDALAASGTVLREATVIGGGSRSRLWVGVLAAALGIPLHRLAAGELGGAFGAARLARLAVTGQAAEAVCITPERLETIAPDPGLAAAYAERLPRWRALYPALSSLEAKP
jgi:xylulokinase